MRAVLHTKQNEDPNVRLSVSQVCRLANVNRAGLYEHHLDLVKEIKARSAPQPITAGRDNGRARVDSQNSKSGLNSKALLYLCLEFQMEIRTLRALIPEQSRRKKTRAT